MCVTLVTRLELLILTHAVRYDIIGDLTSVERYKETEPCQLHRRESNGQDHKIYRKVPYIG